MTSATTSATPPRRRGDRLDPMPRPSPRAVERHTPGPSRAEAKERTRQTLLDEALDLPEAERPALFAGHSLRAGLASSAEVDERRE